MVLVWCNFDVHVSFQECINRANQELPVVDKNAVSRMQEGSAVT
jgi:hypothetical protein